MVACPFGGGSRPGGGRSASGAQRARWWGWVGPLEAIGACCLGGPTEASDEHRRSHPSCVMHRRRQAPLERGPHLHGLRPAESAPRDRRQAPARSAASMPFIGGGSAPRRWCPTDMKVRRGKEEGREGREGAGARIRKLRITQFFASLRFQKLSSPVGLPWLVTNLAVQNIAVQSLAIPATIRSFRSFSISSAVATTMQPTVARVRAMCMRIS